MHARTHARMLHTYVRTHVAALIRPCDSRQSEKGRRTPLSLCPSLFLSGSLVGSLATRVVATRHAGFKQIKPSE